MLRVSQIEHINCPDKLLEYWRRTVFEWGWTDCMLSVADYIHACGGREIASQFRGTYSTREQALARMRAAGGAEALADATGLMRTASPGRGDVVVIDFAEGVAGVHTGHSIAFRRERGVAEISHRLIPVKTGWKISC